MTLPATNAAILFALDGYGTRTERLMGRQAAGEGFLNGFLTDSGVDQFYCYCNDRAELNAFCELAAPRLKGRSVTWITTSRLAAVADVGTLYVPGPALATHAWHRHRLVDQRSYSVCGVTHTTASEAVMRLVTEMVTTPVQTWDALICTSNAVKSNIHRLLDGQEQFLELRTGATKFVRPQLPVIPLGVDTIQFAKNPAARTEWRNKLKLSEESIAVLFVGRLSFHAKAHHVPMYRALESATQQTGKNVTLLMAGWFANDAIEAVFREDAARYCPSVRVHFIDGRKPDVRYSIWQAADVFLSLSDNIQESFGLTPVEAMAAGLPTVVSDWDGYRDTVRDGIDGFRIPCVSPAPGFGGDHAARFELGIDNYDHYCSGTSQFIAVDIDAATAALTRLFADPELRGSMGAAGRARAVTIYDWSTIIHQYQSLWDELRGLRKSAAESVPRGNPSSVNPVFRDPWWLYEQYATSTLQPDHIVSATPAATVETLKMLWTGPSTCPGHLQSLLPTLEELNELIRRARVPMTVSDLVKSFPAIRQPFLMRSTLWLMKYGLIAITKI